MSINGTRIQASASKHKEMNYGRMAEVELSEKIKEMLSRAEAADEAEYLEHWVDGGSGMLPEHLATKQQRRERLREHIAVLEAQTAAAVEAEGKDPAAAKASGDCPRPLTSILSQLKKRRVN